MAYLICHRSIYSCLVSSRFSRLTKQIIRRHRPCLDRPCQNVVLIAKQGALCLGIEAAKRAIRGKLRPVCAEAGLLCIDIVRDIRGVDAGRLERLAHFLEE
jgi:hypothetical protein